MPPKSLPPQPPNTFLNLPTTPEKGPLYVLLYDLVNMDNEDQMLGTANQHSDQIRGREQLIKFMQRKPEGSRFAILVWSDGLHLLQGFTSDRAKLLSVLDTNSPKPHIPKVFLMGENQGRGDPDATLAILRQVSEFVDGIPGRKNLIWFSGGFPVVLFAGKDDGPRLTDQIKSTINLLAQNQVAIYPVDVRGVVYTDAHSSNGLPDERVSEAKRAGASAQGGGGGSGSSKGGASSPGGDPSPGPHGENVQQGVSLLSGSYNAEDELAKLTGGRAFYSNNDVADELNEATEAGSGYYSLTYAPTNRNYDGSLRHIRVTLADKNAHLEYRRAYYGTDSFDASGSASTKPTVSKVVDDPAPEITRARGDALSVSMQHGAPTMHQLLFAVQVHAVGAPETATSDQMAALSTATNAFHAQHKSGKIKPIPLQRYDLSYRVFGSQFHSSDQVTQLEIAAAAYDADGGMLTSKVMVGTRSADNAQKLSEVQHNFRLEQQLAVPLSAAFFRFAVRDAATGRLGATEITLPLGPASEAVSSMTHP